MDIRQEIPVKSFSIAAYICKLDAAGCQHLVIKRASSYLNNVWQMVSGRIEQGETGWQAALREIREETGLTPDRFCSANMLESFYEAKQNCINLVPIFIAFIDTTQTVQISHEHSDYRWITLSETDQYLAFHHHRQNLQTLETLFVLN
jgi:dihydroneopterin triphosphate diphosphatase